MTLLADLYLEVNLALLVGALVFWLGHIVLAHWQPAISQQQRLFLARAIFIISCSAPVVIVLVSSIPSIHIKSMEWGATLYTSAQHSIGSLQAMFEAMVSQPQTVAIETAADNDKASVPQWSSEIVFDHDWLWWAAGLGCFLGGVRFLYQFFLLRALLKKSIVYKSYGRIRVLFSQEVSIPFATIVPGKSCIVLPYWMLSHPSHLRIVIAHEGQHHRNGDTVWIVVIEALKTAFFWNPAIYYWRDQLSHQQELACDEALITQRQLSPYHYANCLLDVVRQSSSSFTGGHMLGIMLFSKRKLSKLHERILSLNNYNKVSSAGTLVKVLVVAILGLVFLLSGAIHLAHVISNQPVAYSIDDLPPRYADDAKAVDSLFWDASIFWNQGDAHQLAQQYTLDGEYWLYSDKADDVFVEKGKEKVKRLYQQSFIALSPQGVSPVMIIDSSDFQFFPPNGARIELDYTLYKQHEADKGSIIYKLVKENNHWRIRKKCQYVSGENNNSHTC
ncbi:MAG: M56 family metallopeptidase [Cellvibrionaceae bacterium]